MLELIQTMTGLVLSQNVKDSTKNWDDSNGHLRGVLSQEGQGLTRHIIFQKCILCM